MRYPAQCVCPGQVQLGLQLGQPVFVVHQQAVLSVQLPLQVPPVAVPQLPGLDLPLRQLGPGDHQGLEATYQVPDLLQLDPTTMDMVLC